MWRLALLWLNISQSPCHLQRSDAAPSSQMPGWSPHHRPPGSSHWPGSAQEVGLDCGPEVFLTSLLQVWVQIFIQAAIPCSERWISAILRIFWWEIWIWPHNMRAFPPQICLVFLSSWEMFVFQGMPSLLKKASELLQVLEVRRGWFGVKKQQTLTCNRATIATFKTSTSGGRWILLSKWLGEEGLVPTVLLFGTQQQRYVFQCDFPSLENCKTFHSSEHRESSHRTCLRICGSLDRTGSFLWQLW